MEHEINNMGTQLTTAPTSPTHGEQSHQELCDGAQSRGLFSAIFSKIARFKRERGAALVEFGIAVPLLLALMALTFDVGTGFGSARSASAAARSAARVAAASGADRLSDYRALDAVKSAYRNDTSKIQAVTVFRSSQATTGTLPAACMPGGSGMFGFCNVYTGAQVANITESQFASPTCSGEIDSQWCPTARVCADGHFVGVAVWVDFEPIIGIFDANTKQLQGKAVFPIWIG